jgi:ArsR family transcriptional regulator
MESTETAETAGATIVAEPKTTKEPKVKVAGGKKGSGLKTATPQARGKGKGERVAVTPAAKLPAKAVPTADTPRIRQAANLFKMGGETMRLTILLKIEEAGGMSVGKICQGLGQHQPAISHHLALLRMTQLVEDKRDGKMNIYSLTDVGKMVCATARRRGVAAKQSTSVEHFDMDRIRCFAAWRGP